MAKSLEARILRLENARTDALTVYLQTLSYQELTWLVALVNERIAALPEDGDRPQRQPDSEQQLRLRDEVREIVEGWRAEGVASQDELRLLE